MVGLEVENRRIANKIFKLVEDAPKWSREFCSQKYLKDYSCHFGEQCKGAKGATWTKEGDPREFAISFETTQDVSLLEVSRTSGTYGLYLYSSELDDRAVLRIDAECGMDPFARVTTPYGVLPHMVFGLDGGLFSFGNNFGFGRLGRALKSEGIFDLSFMLDGVLPQTNIWRMFGVSGSDQIRKLDFNPRPEDHRYVALSPGDYENIHVLLDQIETGFLKLKNCDP